MSNATDGIDYYNYLAIDLLERLGNPGPTQDQIDCIENLLIFIQRNQFLYNKLILIDHYMKYCDYCLEIDNIKIH